MLKLRKLIKEHTWDREFGDPLVTFEDVMKKHQVNKLKEGWWDNMGDAGQKAYIKKHGKAPGSAGGDEDDTAGDPEDAWDDEEGRAKPTGKTDADTDDYDMGEVPGSREEWEDIEPGDPEMRSGDESAEELGDLMKQQQNHIEDMFEKGADREDIEAAEGNLEDLEREYDEKVAAGEEKGSEYSEDDPPPENQGDPDWEEFNLDAWGEKLDRAADDGRISGEDYKELEGTLEKIEDAYAKGDTETAEKLSAEYRRKTSGKFPWRGEESPGRTGNELNQETLTVDGKQFRRISEGVEKQPKPKYAFSEFYQRFKR